MYDVGFEIDIITRLIILIPIIGIFLYIFTNMLVLLGDRIDRYFDNSNK